jgi:hypothetical protein
LSLIRKVFWPSAIALGVLVFLGAIGSGNVVRTASADEGDICEIVGPEVILEGETYLYVAYLDADTDNQFVVSIDNTSGNAKITSVVDDDGDSYDTLAGTNLIKDVEPVDTVDLDDDVLHQLLDVDEDFELAVNHCGTATADAVKRILSDGKLEGIITGDMTATEQAAAVASIVADLNAGEFDCDDIALNAAKAAVAAGATSSEGMSLQDFVEAVCENDWDPEDLFCNDAVGASTVATASSSDDCGFDDDSFLDAAIIVDVTCIEAGEFEITFSDQSEDDDAMTLAVLCQGAPDDATITAQPNKLEIAPAMGSVSHSLITVDLLADDEQAGPGTEVDFTTDKCSIETSGVDNKAEYEAARAIFAAYNLNVAATATAIEDSAAAKAAVDGTRTQDTTVSFGVVFGGDDHTVAAAILGCGPADTGATVATPGEATITAVIAVDDGQDIVRTVKVTVIGPPHTLTVAAAPSTLRCGEKATVTATVKDSIGQNVSEHTRVEAVTNAGGVLGGTGAVAGLAGPVVPISSTVAETFNGVATFYLLTSEAHSGPYEVVVTTGGSGAVTSSLGGVFSTAPLSAQATVTCTIPTVAAPAPPAAPTVKAPTTGQGNISPPNTGDAGLVDTTGSSWALFAAVGAVAFAVAGLASLKFARR